MPPRLLSVMHADPNAQNNIQSHLLFPFLLLSLVSPTTATLPDDQPVRSFGRPNRAMIPQLTTAWVQMRVQPISASGHFPQRRPLSELKFVVCTKMIKSGFSLAYYYLPACSCTVQHPSATASGRNLWTVLGHNADPVALAVQPASPTFIFVFLYLLSSLVLRQPPTLHRVHIVILATRRRPSWRPFGRHIFVPLCSGIPMRRGPLPFVESPASLTVDRRSAPVAAGEQQHCYLWNPA